MIVRTKWGNLPVVGGRWSAKDATGSSLEHVKKSLTSFHKHPPKSTSETEDVPFLGEEETGYDGQGRKYLHQKTMLSCACYPKEILSFSSQFYFNLLAI